MEAASLSSGYGVPCGFSPSLPPVRAVASSSLSISNFRLLSSTRIHSLTSAGRRCKTTSSSSSTSSSSAALRISCGMIREIKEAEFSEVVLKSNRPVLVEFVATWCGPCRLIAPAIESLAQEYEDKLTIVKIDHDSNPELIQEYKVYGLPALILFKNGKEVPESRREGAITKAKLKEYIDGLLESVSIA